MRISLAAVAALLVLGNQAVAQTGAAKSETKAKIEDVTTKKNEVKDGNIDEQVTNPLLRASMGSRSKYSMSLGVVYEGGSLGEPFSAIRPDIYKTTDNQFPSRLNTSVSARYRWTKSDSISFGTSFGVSTPFQGHVANRVDRQGNRTREGQYNVGDPGLAYNRTFAAGGLQHSVTVGGSLGTSVESRRTDRVGGASLNWIFLKAFQNGITIGLNNGVSYSFYGTTQDPNEALLGTTANNEDFRVHLLPFFEYIINDTFQFRTIARYAWFQHAAGDPQLDRWVRRAGSQSAGLGISVTRDVWVYPNIQWDWSTPFSDLPDNTNVGIQTIINLF